MSLLLRKFGIYCGLLLISISQIALYVGQFETSEATIGIVPLAVIYEASYWMLLILWLFALTVIMPVRVTKPSDIFICLHIIFICLWSAAYWPVTGLLDESQVLLLAALIISPSIFFSVFQNIFSNFIVGNYKTINTKDVQVKWLISVLLLILLVTALQASMIAGQSGGFDYESHYARRINGREIFAVNLTSAYLMQMSTNGVAPLLAFIGGYRRSYTAFLSSVCFSVFCYWLLGTKAAIFNVIFLAFLGLSVKKTWIRNFNSLIIKLFLFLMMFALLELQFYDSSFVADYLLRRVVLVNSTIQTYFIDAMSKQEWCTVAINGLKIDDFNSPEFFIGSDYMHSDLANANTNTYLHDLALRGALGYLVGIVVVCVYMSALDFVYVKHGRPEAFALAAMLGVLLAEQAVSISLVSSGMFLCLLLVLLFCVNRNNNGAVFHRVISHERS